MATNGSNPILYWITLTIILTAGVGIATTAKAEDPSWHLLSEGDGTAFEERWAATEVIESASSSSTSDMYLGVNTARNDQLNMYVTLQILLFSNCTQTVWKVAIDQTLYSVTTDPSENEDAIFFEISSEDYKAFWGNFVAGDRLAIRFTSECQSVFDEDTTETQEKILVFSLSGSRAAVEHVLGGES